MKEAFETRKKIRHRMALPAAVLATAAACMLLLFLTGLIPQRAIASSVEESAQYFYENDLFPYLKKGQFNTRQDNYADCILINLMYHVEGEELIPSLIRASYYNPERENVNISLKRAVEEEQEPNVDYFRYWHGSMVLLRPLFVFFEVTRARLILGILLAALTGITAGLLIRRKERALAIVFLLGNGVLQVWMLAYCIEYVTTFLVMNGISIAGILGYGKWKGSPGEWEQKEKLLMAVSGVITCFVDFLTTETLTVTVPLFLLLVMRYRDNGLLDGKTELRRMAQTGLIWGVSYALMFGLKWALAALILGKEAFLQAFASAGERIAGTVTLDSTNLTREATALERLVGALGRNQGCIFPFREEMGLGAAMGSFFILLFLSFALIYLFRDKRFDMKMLLLGLVLAAVPYLRYLVLNNHAYLHYFFTYRAQLVTVMVLLFSAWEFGLKRFVKS